MILKEGRNINMDKEEYYRRIEKINDKFRTDRVSADEEYQLVCQRNYLSTTYIENLEHQVKKQKEVIDKAIEYVEWNKDKAKLDNNTKEYDNYTFLNEENINELLDILS